jgi:hypothetical protein
MHDELQALRQALEDGELEHDLALEVADQNLEELDEGASGRQLGELETALDGAGGLALRRGDQRPDREDEPRVIAPPFP